MKRNRFDTYRGYRKDKIIPPVILAFCRSLLWRNGKRDRFKNDKLWVRLPLGVSKYVSTNQREHIFRANFRSPIGRGRCFKPSSVQVQILSEVPNKSECNSVARSLGLGPRSRRFESCHSDLTSVTERHTYCVQNAGFVGSTPTGGTAEWVIKHRRIRQS
jgi:hypothetical protein